MTKLRSTLTIQTSVHCKPFHLLHAVYVCMLGIHLCFTLCLYSRRESTKGRATRSKVNTRSAKHRTSLARPHTAATTYTQAVLPAGQGFTKFTRTQLHVVTSQFVMAWVSALRARIEDGTGSRHDFVEVNSLLYSFTDRSFIVTL